MFMFDADKKVIIRRCGNEKLKSKLLRSYIESEDGYNATMSVITSDDHQAFIELENYSGKY